MAAYVEPTREGVERILVERWERYVRLEELRAASHGKVNRVFFVRAWQADESGNGETLVRMVLKMINPAWEKRKTLNEANAIRLLARAAVGVRVPEVYAVEHERERSAVGCEYILMEQLPGTTLANVWSGLNSAAKRAVVHDVVDIIARMRSIQFEAIGNFTSSEFVDAVGTLVALEPKGDGKTIIEGPYKSFYEYMKRFLEVHVDSLERQKDEATAKYVLPARKFMAQVIDGAKPESSEIFFFTHGDLSANNIMVTHEEGAVAIEGLIDFEWSCAAPFEVELHRGIGFLRKDPLWLPVFWEEMDARGLCRPPAYELRSDVCMVEKLIGNLESYKSFFAPDDVAARNRFLEERSKMLEDILQRHGCV